MNGSHLIKVFLISLALIATVHSKEKFQIEHLPQVKHVIDVVASPSENLLAYTLSEPRDIVAGDEDGSSDTHLYVIKGDQAPIRFIAGKGRIGGLSFGPKSEKIYFTSKREGDDTTSLYAISLAGGEAEKVYSYDTNIEDYVISANGESLYFVAKEKEQKNELKDKGFKAYVFEEDFRMAKLWKWNFTEPESEAESIFSKGDVSSITLSSNNEFIVAAVAPTNLIDDYYMQRDLHVISLKNHKVLTTVDMPGKLGKFIVSPDNKKLAIYAGTDIHDTSTGVLMVADIKTGALTQLTQNELQYVMDIAWKDGDILAAVHKGVETELVQYNTKGNIEKTLPTPDDIALDYLAVSKQGIYFLASSAAHPTALFAVTKDGVTKLTQHNTWLEDIELGKQTTFEYKARDGEMIQGLLMTPNGKKPSAGWPLIMMIHGGPESHYSDGWLTGYSNPGHFGTAQGYAVFYPNYRGSTGRGVAFAKAHQNDYAGKEFNDIVDGLTALAEAGIIDKDRVGITGGSYGGYASMWAATAQSEYFKAAVAFVGISNQISKFGTSDIPNEMHLVHSLVWPWENNNWMRILERSPVYHAGKANTPILILHGEDDTRVHPSQSMELFRSIKVRTDTPVRLVFYPGEGHGNRKAAARYDYSLRLMRWMNTYLAEDATRETEKPPFDLNLAEKLTTD